ncbi:uncharacterized protein LOC135164493 [Diachasmimorpha longicaudata]|uniref:uncharacterized protein LOC135164493 n=1 Tax=Diachasmimorpha longicaudata TaxID=58733 RepID=UPI0030B8B847
MSVFLVVVATKWLPRLRIHLNFFYIHLIRLGKKWKTYFLENCAWTDEKKDWLGVKPPINYFNRPGKLLEISEKHLRKYFFDQSILGKSLPTLRDQGQELPLIASEFCVEKTIEANKCKIVNPDDTITEDNTARIGELNRKISTWKGVTTVARKNLKLLEAKMVVDIPTVEARMAKYEGHFSDISRTSVAEQIESSDGDEQQILQQQKEQTAFLYLYNTSYHALFRCKKYKELPVDHRIKIAKQMVLCLNCLNKHKQECRYSRCSQYGEPHNSLLHSSAGTGEPVSAMTARLPSSQVMTAAVVNVINKSSSSEQCRVLLDTGASANFITEELATKLKLPRKPCVLPVGTLSEMATFTKGVVTATIKSRHNGFQKELSFLTVPRIADLIPTSFVRREALKIPANIRLADPDSYKPAPIDMLIGTGPTLSFLCTGQIDLSYPGGPDLYLHKTQMGWVIGGSIQVSPAARSIQCHHATPEFKLEKVWEVEEVPKAKTHSIEKQQAVDHFKGHYTRDSTGKYTVALPFNSKKNLLGNSYNMAFRRFQSLERKFSRDPELFKAYSDNIEEYLKFNYLTEVRDPSDTGYYLPHHAVVKKNSLKTTVRVVYDGSAKTTTDISLNETLLVGPKLQKDIFWQVLHFRTHLYALTGDIEKMFLQFGVREEDRRYQRILWRNNSGRVAVYELNNVTFGLSSSPYEAVQCLQQLAEDEAQTFQVATRIVKQNMYVDDLLCGFDSRHDAKYARDEITQLLAQGGLTIKHWASNDPRLLQGLHAESIHQKLQLNDEATLKTLGIYWDA